MNEDDKQWLVKIVVAILGLFGGACLIGALIVVSISGNFALVFGSHNHIEQTSIVNNYSYQERSVDQESSKSDESNAAETPDTDGQDRSCQETEETTDTNNEA